ncbi:Uncharacterized protein BM_BM1470 [Brugia malayi]|uniref:Bm1470 n=1 Tax=Brugia malayi TaxID=6279 RepID=A0A0K0J1G4_BRUMA|nr:Uncharacterized protein BM_BM1470 [Brugia malayi]CDP99440.1 Bm1470 [Brugia malayi]VIP00397.1 Uncharacterized protein BM_BM1470 [Brugia malayi]
MSSYGEIFNQLCSICLLCLIKYSILKVLPGSLMAF